MIDGSTNETVCECCNDEWCNSDIVSRDYYLVLFDLKMEQYADTGLLTFIQLKSHSPQDDYVWLEECGDLVLCREME